MLTRVIGLRYRGELVGLRVAFDGIALDISRSDLRNLGFRYFSTPENVDLHLFGKTLMTKDEADGSLTVKSVSLGDEQEIGFMLSVFSNSQNRNIFTTFEPPHMMSLGSFLADENWAPRRVEGRTDEYRNQHLMRQPDGTDWRGGWIGSFRSLRDAKIGFHRNQTMWAIHGGKDVADAAVYTSGYEWLKQAKDAVILLESGITISKQTGESVMLIDGERRRFNLSEFPYRMRVSQREFVAKNGLVPSGLIVDKSLYPKEYVGMFSNIELVCIALCRAVKPFIKE